MRFSQMLCVLALGLPLVACAADTDSDNSSDQGVSSDNVTAKTAKTDAALVKELEASVKGLLFTSESDYPYTVVSADLKAGEKVTAKTIAAKFASIPETKDGNGRLLTAQASELVGFDTFEADDKEDPTIDPDQAKYFAAFAKAKDLIRTNLKDVRVVRFGAKKGKSRYVDGPVVQIFIVGRSASGKLIGLRTTSIET